MGFVKPVYSQGTMQFFAASLMVAALSLQGTIAIAQERAEVLSLSQIDCIAIALDRHPGIKARRDSLGATYQQVQVARSGFLPNIGLNATYSYIDEPRSVDVNILDGPAGQTLLDGATFFEIARQANGATAVAALDGINVANSQFQLTRQGIENVVPSSLRTNLLGQNFVTTQLSLVQPLWTNGKIQARYCQAQTGSRIARYDVQQTRNEISFNVSRAYQAILLTKELYRAANRAAEYAAGVAQITRDLVDEGDDYVTTADVLRAETLVSLYREQAVGFQVSTKRATAALKLAMGIEQYEQVELNTESLQKEMCGFDLDQLNEMAFCNRPELKKIGAFVKIASLEQRVARAERLPQVGAFASYNTLNDDENFSNPNDSQEWAVGVQAAVPLYTGGRNAALVRRAQYETSAARQLQRLVKQQIQQEVRDAYLELEEMSARLEQTQTAKELADRTIRAFRDVDYEDKDLPKLYENLLTTRLLLLTAEGRFFQSLFSYNLALAKIRLVAAMDPLTEFVSSSDESEILPAPTASRNRPSSQFRR